MQTDMAEGSHVSEIEQRNTMLTEKINTLERENKEYEERLYVLNESQARLNLQGITKLKNKLSKLKDTIAHKNSQCAEYENELYRAKQTIEAKDQELSTVINQLQELRRGYENDLKQKDYTFMEKMRSKYTFTISSHIIFSNTLTNAYVYSPER